jgi:membrane protease YdiL (CAAX protease family)
VTAVAAPSTPSYWRAAREPRYALLFVVPLFILYQVLVALEPVGPQGSWRNGADVLLQQVFIAVAGSRGPLLFLVVLNAVGGWLIVRDLRRHPGRLRTTYFWLMLLEAAALAVVVGVGVGTLTAQLVRPPPQTLALAGGLPDAAPASTRLMLSIGAGLYEELLFRVLVVGTLAELGRRVFKWRPWAAAAVAVGTGALAFSAFHYVGPGGDALELYSFVFRTIGGLFFSLLYVLRGFGITAWTHALYDVLVMFG